MARYRSRSRSYSPRRRSRTPPRGRKRYDDDPRDRYRESRSHRDRRSPAPSGLLVRNLPLDARYFMFFFELSLFFSLMEELNGSFAFVFVHTSAPLFRISNIGQEVNAAYRENFDQ